MTTRLFLTIGLILITLVPAARGQLLVTLGKKTTRITSPLKPDGYPDYTKALNEHFGKIATADKNLAVDLWKITGPVEINKALKPLFFQHLRMDNLPEQGDYFRGFLDHTQWRRPFNQANGLTLQQHDERYRRLQRQYDDCMERPWTDAQAPEMAAWLKRYEALLERTIVATENRTEYFNPYIVEPASPNDATPELIRVLLPGASRIRELARGLKIRGNHELSKGDFKKALRTSLAIHRLGRLSSKGGTIIEGLVGIAIDRMASELDIQILQFPDLTRAQIMAHKLALAKLIPLSSLVHKIDVWERYAYLDAIITIAKHGPQAIENMTEGSSGTQQPAIVSNITKNLVITVIDWDEVLRKGNAMYDEINRIGKIESTFDRNAQYNRFEERLENLFSNVSSPGAAIRTVLFSGKSMRQLATDQMSNIMLSIMLPAVTRAVEAEVRCNATVTVNQVAYGLEAYHRDQGRYPDNLAALTGTYIDKIPQDPFSRGNLTYRQRSGGYVLYSFGPNMEDNQGKNHEDKDASGGDDIRVRMKAE